MSWPTPGCEKLIDAMTVAEGGPAAFIRAVRISIPSCDDLCQARQIAANTIAHALWDYVGGGYAPGFDAFVTFLGARWAPVGAANDPQGLNRNWVPNVLAALRSSGVIV